MEKGKNILKDENINIFWNFIIGREIDVVLFCNKVFFCKLFCNGFILKML